MLKFDVRDEVKFKFTEKGTLELDYDSQFYRDILFPTKDKDGYYKLPFLDLDLLYWNDIFNMIEKDIIINDKYIFDIENGMAEIGVSQMGEFWFKQKFGEEVLNNFPITRDGYRLIPFGQILYYDHMGVNLSLNSKDIVAMDLYLDAKELTKKDNETNNFSDSVEIDETTASHTTEQPKQLVKKPKKDVKK